MTLGRQLMLLGLVVLMGLFIGMMGFMIKNTQHFLNAQMSQHSQETANILGLSLTTVMKKNDVVFASRMVDSIWDAGYYQTIKVEDLKGAPWVFKAQDVKFEGVPNWFISAVPLSTPQKEAVIQSGWMQIGKIKVASNPGFAYQQIWKTTKESVLWLGFISLVAIILGGLLLYVILKPLRAVTRQANEIFNQHFSIVESLPWTVDLRQVVQAMNKMSGKLKTIFEEHTRQSQELQKQAYQSAVTQIGNRRYFDLQFDHFLQDKNNPASGVLLLIELADFKAINDKWGYQAGDLILKQTADFLKSIESSSILAHLGGASFAMVLGGKSKEESIEVAKSIIQHFSETKMQHPVALNVGLCLLSPDKKAGEILSGADMALRVAQSQGPNTWHCSDKTTSKEQRSASEWAAILKESIAAKNIVLYYQPYQLFNEPDKKYQEVLLRLNVNKELLAAGVFMPMAERLGLTHELDKLVIEAIVSRVQTEEVKGYYSINLSSSALSNPEFIDWILSTVQSMGRLAQHLIIELPEYGVIKRLEQVKDFYKKLVQLGSQTAIDHYGKGFSSFAYLQSLRVNFLKIDGSYVSNIESSSDNQFFIRSLIDIAHTLDIRVIAESIETQAQLDTVRNLKVDGAQGYFLGRPEALV